MSKLISTIYKSLLRSVSDLIKDVNDNTALEAEYRSWESRDDEDKLPRKTLIGLSGYNFDENNGLWTVRCGVTISSLDDMNLMDETLILDIVHERFGFQKKLALRDPETGDQISELYVSSFHIMPMSQSELRNYRTVGLELMRTDTVKP
jgi:hypothetical protein